MLQSVKGYCMEVYFNSKMEPIEKHINWMATYLS